MTRNTKVLIGLGVGSALLFWWSRRPLLAGMIVGVQPWDLVAGPGQDPSTSFSSLYGQMYKVRVTGANPNSPNWVLGTIIEPPNLAGRPVQFERFKAVHLLLGGTPS